MTGLKLIAAMLFYIGLTALASAQTFKIVSAFDGTGGIGPEGLTQSSDGNFYGVTPAGGISNSDCVNGNNLNTCGTVFKATLSGALTTVYEFCQQPDCTDGYIPYADLTLGANGSLYGTTSQGGEYKGDTGTAFKIAPSGSLATVSNFCSLGGCSYGSYPTAPLFEAANGNFYGTTQLGGSYGTLGNIFEMTPTGGLTNIFSFDQKDGEGPNGLIQASDGNFYGTTGGGGTGTGCYRNGCGTVFKFSPGGKLTTLYSFCKTDCSDGDGSALPLIQASDGNLYGAERRGGLYGPYGFGTIFRLTKGNVFTTLYSFCSQANCIDGSEPDSLIQGTDGNFYGTTSAGGDPNCFLGNGCGTIFELTLSGVLTTLHTFEYTDGLEPSDLIQGTNGTFYGTTGGGGIVNSVCEYGCGTIFSLDKGLGPFVSLVVAGGSIGRTESILGQGFTGTTSVSLNGSPMTFKVVADTFIRATVPAGATTGYVTVTTPSGVLTSNVPFRVIP